MKDQNSFCDTTGLSLCHCVKYIVMAILAIAIIVYVGALTRNALKNYNYIGKSPEFQDRITIEGTGKVSVSPDIATVNVGVITEKRTVADAQNENTKKMNDIVSALKNDFNIDSDDLKTSQYRINPRYQYDNGRRSIVGYEVNQSLTVKIRDFDKIGNVMSKAGDLGANSVNGPNFTIDDPEEYKAQAREKAIEQAKEKAQVLARQVGINLGPIVNFSENVYSPIPYLAYADSYSKSIGIGGDMEIAPQIEAGSEEVSVTVSISYEIR